MVFLVCAWQESVEVTDGIHRSWWFASAKPMLKLFLSRSGTYVSCCTRQVFAQRKKPFWNVIWIMFVTTASFTILPLHLLNYHYCRKCCACAAMCPWVSGAKKETWSLAPEFIRSWREEILNWRLLSTKFFLARTGWLPTDTILHHGLCMDASFTENSISLLQQKPSWAAIHSSTPPTQCRYCVIHQLLSNELLLLTLKKIWQIKLTVRAAEQIQL